VNISTIIELLVYSPCLIHDRAYIATKNTVERLNGILKRRFVCLSKKLATKLSTSMLIITSCAVLHNIAIHRHDVLSN